MEASTKFLLLGLTVTAVGAWAMTREEPSPVPVPARPITKPSGSTLKVIVPNEATAAMVKELDKYAPGAWPPSVAALEQLVPGSSVALGVVFEGCGGFILAKVEKVEKPAGILTVTYESAPTWWGCSPSNAPGVKIGSRHEFTLNHVFLIAPGGPPPPDAYQPPAGELASSLDEVQLLNAGEPYDLLVPTMPAAANWVGSQGVTFVGARPGRQQIVVSASASSATVELRNGAGELVGRWKLATVE